MKLKEYLICLGILSTFFTWIYPFIGSAYRIEIAGLGTIILLGDQQDARPEIDQEQFEVLTQFLKQLANKEVKAVVNLETLSSAPEYYNDNDTRNSMIRNRLSEREVRPSLKSLVAALQNTELKEKIIFTSSNLKRSNLWNIKLADLSPLVKTALANESHESERLTFGSLRMDHESIVQKFERFKKRSKKNLPSTIAPALEKKMEEQFSQLHKQFKTAQKFWHKYSDPKKSLDSQTICDLIREYAFIKIGPSAIHFVEQKTEQSKTVKLVTNVFNQEYKKKLETEYASSLINAPWIMDVFNAFTHHKAKTAVFYASDTHIHSITLFLQSLSKDLPEKHIQFKAEYVLKDVPLSTKQFEDVLGII